MTRPPRYVSSAKPFALGGTGCFGGGEIGKTAQNSFLCTRPSPTLITRYVGTYFEQL